MKRDGRTVDLQTLETIRQRAVERRREGEHPADVIASYGFHRTTIYRWLNAADDGGDVALRSTRATDCPVMLDGLRAHKKVCVKKYIESTEGKLTLRFLPGYASDWNPDELVWSHVKRTGVARHPLRKGGKPQ